LLLKELSELNGISGREEEVREYLRARIKGKVDKFHTDSLGNLIAVKGQGRPGPKVMLTAHMDEVGLMVLGIDPSGLLKIGAVGGIDPRVLVSKPVLIGRERVPGVIGAKPIHLQEKAERKKAIPLKGLYVDIGAKDREDAGKVVKVGDPVAFATQAGLFGEGLFKGKALDDRVGCAVLVELMQMETDFPLYFVFTVQEELGLRGARVAAYGIDPDLCLTIEGTFAGDLPEAKGHQVSTRLGRGPAITVMDRSIIVQKKLVDSLVAAGKAQNIPYQLRELTVGGTDAGAVSLTREGVPSAVVSVPCRYIHSPVSILSLADYHHTVQLVKAFLEGGYFLERVD
jgi:putative aminopeptidase FrvX